MANSRLWAGVLVVGPIQTNCYILRENTGSELCTLIDPGDDPDRIIAALEKLGTRPELILLTHAHYDHIQAVNELREHWPSLTVCISDIEKSLLAEPRMATPYQKADYVVTADRFFTDGETFTAAGHEITVLASPGHTAGSVCYYVPDSGMLFAGDTIFLDSCGRTDLPTGSEADMDATLHRLLTSLPEETVIFPGHGPQTTVAHERDYLR